MDTASFCDLCSEENKTSSATKFCSECEERLCTDCTKSHDRFKAFKSHHVIDMAIVASNISITAKKICNIHPDMLIDYYCTDHEIICCRACIPKDHRKCESVLPLEHASKNVKKSSLFTDTMAVTKHLITTLHDLHDNRGSNLQSLLKTKAVITKQIREVKSRLLKQIDDLESDLLAELSSLNRKHEVENNKQKEEISQVLVSLNAYEKEIDFLKDHGSDKQLLISLHQHVKNIQRAEASVLQIISNSQEIVMAFDEKKDIKLECIGTLSESVISCQIQYKSKILQQAQIMAQPTKHITGFEMDAVLKLKTGNSYCLTDICVTCDNKLLLINYVSSDQKLYVYRDCKDYEKELKFSSNPLGVAVIPGTDKAVVTLPASKYLQFINTKSMTKSDKVKIGFSAWGITAGNDRIYVGGESGNIKTLDINGKILKTIQQGLGTIYFISYDDTREEFILRCPNELLSINLDGTLIYSKKVAGTGGLTRDRQSNVYYGGYRDSNIRRMSPDGKNCKEMIVKDDGIHRPYGMCFNNDFTKLFVINNDYKSVCVYKCKY